MLELADWGRKALLHYGSVISSYTDIASLTVMFPVFIR